MEYEKHPGQETAGSMVGEKEKEMISIINSLRKNVDHLVESNGIFYETITRLGGSYDNQSELNEKEARPDPRYHLDVLHELLEKLTLQARLAGASAHRLNNLL